MKRNFPKLSTYGTTIFSVMSQWAQQHNAINLSQGFPDFQPDSRLLNYYQKAIQEGHHQYAPMPGILELREQIASKVALQYSIHYDPATEVTITAGGTQAIFTAMATLLQPGDEVIVFEPAYDAYAPIISLFQAKQVSIPLYAPDFSIDWELVRSNMTDNTKLVIINTPNNPTGRIWTSFDFQQLTQIVEDFDCYVLSDEVYEHVVFDGKKPSSVIQYPSIRERSFVVASFGKLCHATGWKVGYCLAPSDMMEAFRKIHQFQVFSVHTPAQYAIANYLEDPASYQQLADFFEYKRNLLSIGLSKTRLKPLPCEGTYFLLADYSQVSSMTELEFCKYLAAEWGVAGIPVSAFYTSSVEQNLIRFCFAKEEGTILKALAQLEKL
jgi:methionine aminotransferase